MRMSTPSNFGLKKLRNVEKSRDGDADDSSSIRDLPDEIILQILNKLIDLKTLCFCYLVSRRFSSIVLQVNAISFTAPFLNRSAPDNDTVNDVYCGKFPLISSFYGDSLFSAIKFLRRIRGVKFLCIEFPASSYMAIDNGRMFKWKVKFGNRIESFMFLSPNSVFDKDGFYLNGNGDEEEGRDLIIEMHKQKFDISYQCLNDAIGWHKMLLYLVKDLPMLEEISITDFGRRGRLSFSGEKLSEVKEWVHSASEAVMSRVEVPDQIVSNCYIPVLKLPVSGHVMKGIYFCVMEMKDRQGGYDGLINREDGFEDKEEASAYTEAVMEILEKHRGQMLTYVDGALQL